MVCLHPRSASGPRVSIDLGAVAANTRTIAGRTRAAVMAVVKADGFGHGGAAVAETALANGAGSVGVATIAEALQLRDAGVRAPMLSWLNDVDADFATAVSADVQLAVPSQRHLEAIVSVGAFASVHLHLDTGMARDGAPAAQWSRLCRAARAAERAGRIQVVGVMGHLACADDPSDPRTATGRRKFAEGLAIARAAGLRPRLRHLAATSATLSDPRTHHNLCRIGAGLVGIDLSGTVPLRPAMTLTAPVVTVRWVRAGTAVGYGHTWVAPAATHLASIALGYADGLPRGASGHAEVSVRSRRRRIVGRISMDQAVIDVGDEPVSPGETVTVFGPGEHGEPTVSDWAAWAGTIEHEIVTGIGARVRRDSRLSPVPA
jgi:alanine racemase